MGITPGSKSSSPSGVYRSIRSSDGRTSSSTSRLSEKRIATEKPFRLTLAHRRQYCQQQVRPACCEDASQGTRWHTFRGSVHRRQSRRHRPQGLQVARYENADCFWGPQGSGFTIIRGGSLSKPVLQAIDLQARNDASNGVASTCGALTGTVCESSRVGKGSARRGAMTAGHMLATQRNPTIINRFADPEIRVKP